MASSSSLSEPPNSPPRTPPREPRSLKCRPFKDLEATPRAVRRSRSMSSETPTTLPDEAVTRVKFPVSAFGRPWGLSYVPPRGGRWTAKGKEKEVATPLTLKPGGPQATGTYDSDSHGEWSDSNDDDSGGDGSDEDDELRPTTLTPVSARAGKGHARPGSPDPYST